MFLLVSVRHVGAHPDELQHGVSIQSSINLGKTFPRISRIRIIPSTQILARVFVYLPPFISQILDFICRMGLILIFIYFGWRDTEDQQFRDWRTWSRLLKCRFGRCFYRTNRHSVNKSQGKSLLYPLDCKVALSVHRIACTIYPLST